MKKDNTFRSSEFFMDTGDILHMLILDETGTPVTVNLVSADEPEVPEAGTPEAPLATDATFILSDGFTANWEISDLATKYYLDVATDSAFTVMVVGYDNRDVGNVLTYAVPGLSGGTFYYYRIRAFNDTGTSDNSNIITLNTTGFNDWFLPSQNELSEMYTNLHLFGVGGFSDVIYWSSTESTATRAMGHNFGTSVISNPLKSELNYVRAVRSFISATIYNLRDTGLAGGLISDIIDNGDGTYTYYETAISDQSVSQAWSNVIALLIGTTLATVGEGKNNTTEIIAQVGHVDSAAKLCNDLVA